MYFSLNQEKIVFHQEYGITIRINGPEDLYYIEVRDFSDGKNESVYLEGYAVDLTGKNTVDREFNFNLLFRCDYEVSIYKFLDEKTATRIYSHRYNDYGKLVRFKFDSESEEDCEIWLKKVIEYTKQFGCIPVIESPFDEINKKVSTFYQLTNVDYYKTFYLGRYPKIEEWKPRQPLIEAISKKGLTKQFWSLQHPRNWETLTAEQIADDILGLNKF